MSCFKLPDNLLKEIESMMEKFWWGDRHNRKIHWVKWVDLGSSKKDGGMGFRDLRAFNLAMLAKQAWRILTNPHSLLSQILKAKYFPNSTFLETKQSSSPSLTWRSICDAMLVLEDGLRWRVGNGELVRVWEDKWLLRGSPSKIITPRTSLPPGTVVKHFIEENPRQWNRELVDNTFWAEDAKAIMEIPLGDERNYDRLIWKYTKSGQFSIRTAYHAAMNLKKEDLHNRFGSSSATSRSDWRFILDAKVPPKVKFFIWRECNNALPTKANLRKRNLGCDSDCDVCSGKEESLMHVLINCHVARQVWALSNTPYSINQFQVDDIFQWFNHAYEQARKKISDLILIICWVVWSNRNKRIFNNERQEPRDIILFCTTYWCDFQNARHLVKECSEAAADHGGQIRVINGHSNDRWKAPSRGVIKINFDAALAKDPNLAGIGIVARNYLGVCLTWKAEVCRGISKPEISEALAARMACTLAHEYGWRDVEIEGDNLSVIKALQSRGDNLSLIGNIIEDGKQALSATSTHKFSWARRMAN